MNASTSDRQAEELVALFMQCRPDGSLRFSDADVRHFLPMAVLSTHADPNASPALRAVMDEFLDRLKLPEHVDADTFVRAVHAYYRRFPPNAELEQEFFAYCRSQAQGELDADKVRKYAKTAGLKLAEQSPLKGIAPSGAGLQLRRR